MKSSKTAGPREPGNVNVSSVHLVLKCLELTVRILHGNDLLVVVQVVQKGSEDPPAGIQLVISDKVGMVALQAVKDERLVGLGDLEVREPSPIGKIELGNHRLHAEAGKLRVHLNVDTLVGLNAHNKLIARNVLEDARRNILELDADLSLLLVKRLARLHDKWNTVPTLVLDVCDKSAECRAAGVLRDSVVLLV